MTPYATAWIVVVALATLSALPAIAADTAGDSPAVDYGKHLANECTSCHRLDGPPGAIPSITGRPKAEFIDLLMSYREERRTNPVMVSVAQSLDEEQMAALAAYFGSLPGSDAAP